MEEKRAGHVSTVRLTGAGAASVRIQPPAPQQLDVDLAEEDILDGCDMPCLTYDAIMDARCTPDIPNCMNFPKDEILCRYHGDIDAKIISGESEHGPVQPALLRHKHLTSACRQAAALLATEWTSRAEWWGNNIIFCIHISLLMPTLGISKC